MSIYIQHDYAQPTAHLRRYSMRLDGFTSIYAPYKSGSMTTKLFIFTGKKLLLNFATSAPGYIKVEIQDSQGKPIPGYSLRDAQELIGNYIEHPASWRSGTDVTGFSNQPIRLHFVMQDANLYSLQFRP